LSQTGGDGGSEKEKERKMYGKKIEDDNTKTFVKTTNMCKDI
jgi:hypothetical protein